MRRLVARLWACLALFVLLLSGCGPSPDEPEDTEAQPEAPDEPAGPPDGADDEIARGGTLRIAMISETATLDPMLNRLLSNHHRNVHIYERLFEVDSQWVPQPFLAEDYEVSDDGTEYTFHLREVLFHNGQPLTADDVVASLQRFATMTSPGANLFEFVDDLRAEGDRTVVLTLLEPVGTVLSALADRQAAILPASVLEAAGEDPLEADQYIGTGPFMLDEWQPDLTMRLVSFDDYTPVEAEPDGFSGRREALVDALEYVIVPEAGSRVAGLETGEFHFAESLQADDFQRLDAHQEIDVRLWNTGMLAVVFNHAIPPFDNVDIRRAVLVGMSMEPIGQSQGPEEIWTLDPGMLFEGMALNTHLQSEDWLEGDSERASTMLEEAGYDGEEVSLMVTSAFPPTYQQAIVIQEQLQDMGMDVRLDDVETSVLQERRGQDTGWHLVMSLFSPVSDATQLPMLACGNNLGQFCEPEMDEALRDFTRAVGDEERQEAHNRIQEVFYEYVAAIKNVEIFNVSATRAEVMGYVGDIHPYFWNVWVDD